MSDNYKQMLSLYKNNKVEIIDQKLNDVIVVHIH